MSPGNREAKEVREWGLSDEGFDIYSGEKGSHFTAGSSSVDITWSHLICKKYHFGCCVEIKL